MKIGLLTNDYNIFIKLYLRYLKKIPINNIFLIVEKSKFPNRNKKIIKDRLSNSLLKKVNFKVKTSKLKNYQIIEVESLNLIKNNKIFKKKKIKFFLNIGIMEIIKNHFFYNKIVNVHPADLPLFRGCSCPEWTIYNKCIPTVTAHLITKKIDAGKIIKKKRLNMKFKNYKEFRSRLYLESIILGTDIIKKLYKVNQLEKLNIKPQKKIGKYYSPMPNNLLKKVKESF